MVDVRENIEQKRYDKIMAKMDAYFEKHHSVEQIHSAMRVFLREITPEDKEMFLQMYLGKVKQKQQMVQEENKKYQNISKVGRKALVEIQTQYTGLFSDAVVKKKYLIPTNPLPPTAIQNLDAYFEEESFCYFEDTQKGILSSSALRHLKSIYTKRIREIHTEVKQCTRQYAKENEQKNKQLKNQIDILTHKMELCRRILHYLQLQSEYREKYLPKPVSCVKVPQEDLYKVEREEPKIDQTALALNQMKKFASLASIPFENCREAIYPYLYETAFTQEKQNYLLHILKEKTVFTEEEMTFFLYTILDAVKIKIKRINRDSPIKKDKNHPEKTVLKNFQKNIEQLLLNEPVKVEDKENPAYYELMQTILQNPMPLKSISKCLHKVPRLLNARQNGKHILTEVLDQYIENVSKEVAQQRGLSYQASIYFKEIYGLFLEEPSLELTEEDDILGMLDDFLDKIKSAPDHSGLAKEKSSLLQSIGEMKQIFERYQGVQEKVQYLKSCLQKSTEIESTVISYEDRRKAKGEVLLDFYHHLSDLTTYVKENSEENQVIKVPLQYTDKERHYIEKILKKLTQTFTPYIEVGVIMQEARECLFDKETLEREEEHQKDVQTCLKNLESSRDYLIQIPNRLHLDKASMENLKDKYFLLEKAYQDETGIKPTKEQIREMLALEDSFLLDIALGGTETVSFGNPHHCFSIVNSMKGRTYLQMHQIDVEAYLKTNPFLEEELRKNQIEGKSSPLEKSPLFQFEEGKQVPTITYQIRIYPNGKCGNLGIYKTVTQLDTYYTVEPSKTDLVKQFIRIHHLTEKYADGGCTAMDTDFEKLFLRKIQTYMQYQYQPAILSCYTKEDEKRLMKAHYEQCALYQKIEKGAANTLCQILAHAYGTHYTNDAREEAVLTSMDIPNYITYINQKLLSIYPEETLLPNGRKIYKHPEDTQELSNACVQSLNQKLGYIPLEEFYQKPKKYIKK